MIGLIFIILQTLILTLAVFSSPSDVDGEPASVGNGSMMGIRFSSSSDVDEVFCGRSKQKEPLMSRTSQGQMTDGSPEQKVETFYGGYVRDLDGNKLVFCKWVNRRAWQLIFL